MNHILRIRVSYFLFALVAQCLLMSRLSSQPTLIFTPVISSGLTAPIDFVNAGDGSNRVFVVQQGGAIAVYDQQFALIGNFLTVSGVSTGGERGLLSMAFSPGYSTNGFFFVYYTNTNGDLELARYHVSADPNVADATSKVILLTIPHPVNSNHNGGKLNFGDDGYLYFATGDGGSGGDPPNNAQNGNVLLGKMLRINPNNSGTAPFYTIPADNPYVSDPNVLDEIWAMGLRNPFRWSFDRQTHDMWIGDVGQDSWEEIDFLPANSPGVNFGWRCYEGNTAYNTTGCNSASSYVAPVFVYPNPAGSASSAVTGGVVYRGTAYPALNGYYFAADVYSGNVYLIKPASGSGWNTYTQTGLPGTIVCFGETEDAEVYAVSLTGSVYRITTDAVPPQVAITSFTATKTPTGVHLAWQTLSEQNLVQFGVEYSTDGTNFQHIDYVAATNSPSGAAYTFDHTVDFVSRIYYRLRVEFSDGSFEYSVVIFLDPVIPLNLYVYPTLITNRILILHLPVAFTEVDLVNSGGAIVLRRQLSSQTGRIDIPLPALASGIYIVKLKSSQGTKIQRVFIRQ